MDIRGKVVLVTGAAQGFGQHIALSCAQRGATVIACDLGSCQETIDMIETEGAKGLGLSFDVSNYEQCTTQVASALERFGRIDALVNNAALYGSLHFAPFEHIDSDEWDACMKVNVKGAWHMAKAVAPSMRAAARGSIINISSNSALFGGAMMTHYATSKAALIGLTRVLATELGAHGIRVNTVCPGAMDTPGTRKVVGDHLQALVEAAPKARLKAVLEPHEVSGSVLFLISDASKMMTAQILTPDGGLTTG